MTQETIIDVVGHMYFRDHWLTEYRGQRRVMCDIRLTWANEMEEITSWKDDLYDRFPMRIPTASIMTLTASSIRVPQLDTLVGEPQPWEPFTFTYQSNRGWLSTTATCAITSVDERHGTEWRVRPSDYLTNGLTFTRSIDSTHPDLVKEQR